MITLNTDAAKLQALLTLAEGFSERRMNAASATALTRTAFDAKRDVIAAMQRDMDRVTPYTLKGVFAKGATANSLQAQVWIAAESKGKSKAQGKYLLPQIEGGRRVPKSFELKLQGKGLMPAGKVAVPTKSTPLDSFGNISRGLISQILTQTVPYGTLADRKKINKVGGLMVSIPHGMGKIMPGIFLIELRDFGKKIGIGRSGKMIPLLLFKDSATYKPRFKYVDAVQKSAEANLLKQLETAIQQHIDKLAAKARG